MFTSFSLQSHWQKKVSTVAREREKKQLMRNTMRCGGEKKKLNYYRS